jgi:hypothetical protein
MAEIKVAVDEDKGLTIHEVVGVITVEEVLSIFAGFASDSPTLYLLWDFSRADVSNAASDDLRKILSVAKEKAHVRQGGKTALLTSGKLEFGLARMYGILSEIYEHPISHRIFTEKDEAIKWLLGEE